MLDVSPGTSLQMRKLGYLWVSSRILKRNFHDSAQNNGAQQQGEQSRKPSSQWRDFKKAELLILCCREWLAVEFIQTFLAVALIHMSDITSISIYKRTIKLLTLNHQVFCYPKVLIQSERTWWFMTWIFMQCICTGYCKTWILSFSSFIMNSC